MINKKTKLFILSAVLSIPFLFALGYFQQEVEAFIYSRQIAENPPKFYIAKIIKAYANQNKDIRMDISVSAKAAGLFSFNRQQTKIIFSKNISKKMPIASLTKLMTAIIASDFYDPNMEIKISKEAVEQAEEAGELKVNEKLRVKDLLYIMLIESSNDAAYALTQPMEEKSFVELMNIKAKKIGMVNTHFYDPTGLDREDKKDGTPENISTVEDLSKLVKYIVKNYPDILKITSIKEYKLILENGEFHHILKNTNKLLGEVKNIVGGKTGNTDRAGQCLILVIKKNKDYLISIVLGSKDRFSDSLRIIKMVK